MLKVNDAKEELESAASDLRSIASQIERIVDDNGSTFDECGRDKKIAHRMRCCLALNDSRRAVDELLVEVLRSSGLYESAAAYESWMR